MKSIDRIKKIIDANNLSIRKFEKLIGASNNSINIALKRKSSVSDETLNKILRAFPEINPVWLLTGEGEMLRDAPTAGGHLEQVAGKMELLARQMELLEKERELLREQVRFLREKLNWAEKQVQELKQSVKEKEKHIRQCRELTKKPGDAVGNKPEKLK